MSKNVNRKIYISINGKEVENSYQGIKKEVQRLSRELDKLPGDTEEFTNKKRELDQVKEKFDDIATATGRTKRGIQQSSNTLGGFKKMALGAVGLLASVFTVDALMDVGRQIIEVRSEFERYFAVLKTSLGSAEAANKEFNMIREFAAETPFSVRQLTDSFVKLTNQGFKPSKEQLRQLGDLAASTGKDFDQLTEAIIDAQTGEFERLKEFGIRAKKEGDKVTFTFKEQETQVDFTSDSIQKYILGLGELEGVSGSMAAISETLGGKISNLGDSWDTLLYNMGESSVFRGAVDLLSRMVGQMNELVATEEDFEQQMRDTAAAAEAELEVIKMGNFTQEQRRDLLEDLQQKYGKEYIPALEDEKGLLKDIDTIQKEMNKNFEKRILQAAFEKEMKEYAEAQANAAKAIVALEKERTKLNQGEQDLTPNQLKQQKRNLAGWQQLQRDTIDKADETKKEITDRFKAMAGELGFSFADLFVNEEDESGGSGISDKLAEDLAKLEEEIREAMLRMKDDPELKMTLEDLIPIGEEGEEGVFVDGFDAMTQAAAEAGFDNLAAFYAWKEQKDEQILASSAEAMGALSNLMGENTEAGKTFASAQALINTYLGASQVIADPTLPTIAKIFTVGSILASGLAQVKAINKVEVPGFSEGIGRTRGLGFKDGSGHEVAGIVHEDEQVIPKWMKQNPRYANTLDALEYARANNIGRYAEGTGSAGSTTIEKHSTTQTINIDRLERVLMRMEERMDKPSIAVVTRQARRDIEEKNALDSRIAKNKILS